MLRTQLRGHLLRWRVGLLCGFAVLPTPSTCVTPRRSYAVGTTVSCLSPTRGHSHATMSAKASRHRSSSSRQRHRKRQSQPSLSTSAASSSRQHAIRSATAKIVETPSASSEKLKNHGQEEQEEMHSTNMQRSDPASDGAEAESDSVPAKKQRRNPWATAEPMDEKKYAVLREVEELMQDPYVHTYTLHAVRDISDAIKQSVKARWLMFSFVPSEVFYTDRRKIEGLVTTYTARALGAALYVRLVHPHDAEGSNAASQSLSRREKQQAELKAVRDGVEGILRRYVSRLIEPAPNELAIDVKEYSTFVSVLKVARKNMEQFLRDGDDFLNRRPVNPDGVPSGPPPPSDLEALSPDAVAADIARAIRREVLTVASDSPKAVRVCIGVATSAALAKLICDAEVEAVVKKLSAVSAAHKYGGKPRETPPLVSIRSLYRHVHTTEACRELMTHVPVENVPVFSPSFASLLKNVLGLRTCGDLYAHRDQLYFCFSHATCDACLSAVYGCMKFPAEEELPLYSSVNTESATAVVRPLALNHISLVNADRTKFVDATNAITRAAFGYKVRRSGNIIVNYGRLTSDKEFMETVSEGVRRVYQHYKADNITFEYLRCSLRTDGRLTEPVVVKMRDTSTFEEVMRAARPQLQGILKLRHRPGVKNEGGVNLLMVRPIYVKVVPLVPPELFAEAEKLQEAFFEMKLRVQRCKWIKAERRRAVNILNGQQTESTAEESGEMEEGPSGRSRADKVVVV